MRAVAQQVRMFIGESPVAASARQIGPDLVYAPDQPLAAGASVRLTYVNGCGEPAELAFTTSSPVNPNAKSRDASTRTAGRLRSTAVRALDAVSKAARGVMGR